MSNPPHHNSCVGGVYQAPQNLQTLGRVCYLRMWAVMCCRISFGGTYLVLFGGH
jgi:hypothetical protein